MIAEVVRSPVALKHHRLDLLSAAGGSRKAKGVLNWMPTMYFVASVAAVLLAGSIANVACVAIKLP